MPTLSSMPEEKKLTFINTAPDDEEWDAHVKMLNEWTEPDRYLRYIIQYARSGKHFPADMHVDLVRQVINQQIKSVLDEVINKWRKDHTLLGTFDTADECTDPAIVGELIDELREIRSRYE